MIAVVKTAIPESIKLRMRYYRYSKNITCSQAGQDFWVYGEVFNEKRQGFFVDIGSSNGYSGNNTFLLEAKYDWMGICIEANKRSFMGLEKLRRSTCLNLCLDDNDGVVDFIHRGVTGGIVAFNTDNKPGQFHAGESDIIQLNTTTLTKVLDDQNAPTVIDYLSIDVEGAEEVCTHKLSEKEPPR